MSLVFSAIVPHPPLLLPSIGREHVRLLEKTEQSMNRLKIALAAVKPDTIIVISPHLTMMPETFTVNHAPQYFTHFREFGDFNPPKKFKCDSLLVERLRRAARAAGKKVSTVSNVHLDYGSGVPLTMLTGEKPEAAVAIVSPTLESGKSQFDFGVVIKEVIMNVPGRTAVVCSADLSHRLSSDTPDGFSPKGKEFNDLMIANLVAGSASPVLQMNEKMIEEAHACGYGPICMFLGIMDKMNCRPELLSYESPFGVGYLTIQFHLD